MATQSLEINKDSYIAFDATSLRDLIVSRLAKENVFTDQVYVGSNISTVIEIISYSFSTLMYYLHKTATESMFSEAQLYENMNRIVKMIGYSPAGYQTATTDISLSALNIDTGTYTVPRYSQLSLGDVVYSFSESFTFEKTIDTVVESIPAASFVRLHQGRYTEFPVYTAVGVANENIVMTVTDTLSVDNNTIDVYVKKADEDTWTEWTRVDNLSNAESYDEVYEVRFNENKMYEITFGDGINGQSLTAGDQVIIYYLASSGAAGEIPSNYLTSATLVGYNSPNYTDLVLSKIGGNIIGREASTTRILAFNNINNSTSFSSYETVEEMRKRAASSFKSQGRLVTTEDYISYINSKFSHFIKDVRVKNNIEYIDIYIKYLYDIGLSNPFTDSRVLHNQVLYSNASNANNIYLFCLPKTNTKTYLMPLQKSIISESITPIKCATTQVMFADPIYVSLDIAIPSAIGAAASVSDISNTQIIIERESNKGRSTEAIKEAAATVITTYVDSLSNQLEPYLDILQLNSALLGLDGVRRVYCKNTLSNITVEGLSIILWNKVYPSDVQITSHNLRLPFFKTVFLNNEVPLLDRIVII